SGIMLGYPPYVRPTQEEALVYAKRIIEIGNKPVILYNNPNRTGFDLSAKSILELSQIDSVVGVKDPGDKQKIADIKNGVQRNHFYYYAGGEEQLEEKVLSGYDRLSSIAGNVYPKEISQWFQNILLKQHISKIEQSKIEYMIGEVYQGNAI